MEVIIASFKVVLLMIKVITLGLTLVPARSGFRTKNLFNRSCLLELERYDVCQNGHHMFYDPNQSNCSCQSNNNRFQDNQRTPFSTVSQIPLYKQLASYFLDEGFSDLLKSRFESVRDAIRKRQAAGSSYNLCIGEDFFDGEIFWRHKSLYDAPEVLFLELYIDAFVPKKRSSSSMATFMATIINLPIEIRYFR